MVFGRTSLLLHGIKSMVDPSERVTTSPRHTFNSSESPFDDQDFEDRGSLLSQGNSEFPGKNNQGFISSVISLIHHFKTGISELQITSTVILEYFEQLIFPTTKYRVRLLVKTLAIFGLHSMLRYTETPRPEKKFEVIGSAALCIAALPLYWITAITKNAKLFRRFFVVIITGILFIMMSIQVVPTTDIRFSVTPLLQYILIFYCTHLTDFIFTLFMATFLSFVYLKRQHIQLSLTPLHVSMASFLSNSGSTVKYVAHKHDDSIHDSEAYSASFYFSTFLLWSLLNMTGCYIYAISKMRQQSAFQQIGQNVLIRQGISAKKEESMKWISAIMPSSIIPDYMKFLKDSERTAGKSNVSTKLISVFSRSYNEVSILFADIVGFTRMSSNKAATEVVKLLNDLFNRFDSQCHNTGCEKLGTLGDCYYCVAGCPSPRRDHAVCCVRMGLRMCVIIKEFNSDYSQDVNMRVGVHTGRVNAAVIGKSRFRFDVYSYAVIIANGMESSGQPGRVHISQNTLEELGRSFRVEPGMDYEIKKEKEFGMSGKVVGKEIIKTYFVIDTRSRTKQHEEQRSVENFDVKFNSKRSLNIITDDHQLESDQSSNRPTWSPDDKRENETIKSTETGLQMEEQENKDESFVRSIKEDPEQQCNLFKLPPLHPITQRFVVEEVERAFQNEIFSEQESINLESPRVAPLLDCMVTFVYLSILFLAHNNSNASHTNTCYVCDSLLLVTCLIFAFPTLLELIGKGSLIKFMNNKTTKNFRLLVLNMLPFIHIMIHYQKCTQEDDQDDDEHDIPFGLQNSPTYFVFSVLSSLVVMAGSPWINIISIVIKVVVFTVTYTDFQLCRYYRYSVSGVYFNDTGQFCENELNFRKAHSGTGYIPLEFISEMIWTSFLIINLVRLNDYNLRLCFFATYEADRKRKAAEDASQRTETLLFNIVPKYVMTHLRQRGANLRNASYAVAVENVGVTFACICNFFANYYREDYKGGESALAILNKIICIFDETMERFKDVEKIKTINDCYMIASGLNIHSVDQNIDQNAHLYNLMDYCFEMLGLIETFNETWVYGDQKFMLKIGYNIGPVTAGIIGTTKPMYDIWGDTVNVASRMYSTSRPGVIQCPRSVRFKLRTKFIFRRRGYISVKGKGNMQTYLCVERKPDLES